MKTAKEIFDYDEKYFGVYRPVINNFGKIIIQVDDVDYQGDSRVFYEEDDKYGYLLFGWGSCSGCDALQACDNVDEVQELMDRLYNSIMWFDSKEDALKYFREHDWEGDYTFYAEEQQEFIEKVINYLEN